MKIPILRLGDILLTSLQSDMLDEETLEFQSEILAKANSDGILGVVLDISPLEVLDSFMTRVINDTASMLCLLGVEVVVCGMQPNVALTLQEMGLTLGGVESALNLDQGMEKIKRRIAKHSECL